MKKFNIRYFLKYFNSRMKVGVIEFEALNIEAVQEKASQLVFEELAEKSEMIDDKFSYLNGMKEMTIAVELKS